MKFALTFLVLVTAATLSNAAVLAPCANDDPASVARGFFTDHAKFYFDSPENVRGLVTPRFFAALERENTCAQGQLCALEAVPWTDAQDGDVEKPIAFQIANRTAENATVKMSYTFALSRKQKRAQSVSLLLARSPSNGCWLVADLVGPKGKSLVSHLEAWHKTFGNGP